jgi:UDP-N-acetylmuramyl pentapeptide phosphotransferase/UDP-N-acetylglucosamine-1-phosphate transferase
MIEMIMSFALAFGISFYALPAIIHIAAEKGLYDFPDERKLHQKPIPALGGLAMFAGFITAFLLSVVFSGSHFVLQYFVAAALIMFFIGLKDDLLNISPFKKFFGQLLAASLLVFKGGLAINSMGGILGIYDLPLLASQIFTIATIVVIINAFNLIDGIDGLAGSLSFLSAALFALYFAVNGDFAYACMATSLAGAVGAFLIFNYPPARIFMGDTGSLLCGLVHATLVIHFIQTAGSASVWAIQSPAAVGFAILFVPLFDTLRVFAFRIFSGIPPFTPDRNHVHHVLLRFGWSHLQITLFLTAVGLAVVLLSYQLQSWGNTRLLLLINGIGFLSIGLSLYLHKRRRQRILRRTIPRLVPDGAETPVISVSPKKAAK